MISAADGAAGGDDEATTLWHGRFDAPPSAELMAFTSSLHFDRALAVDDIAGSRAHVRGLVRGGLLDGNEAAAVLAALDTVEEELEAGTFAFAPTDEDIHTAVERRVTALAGPVGAKLHTGRSRNDQVATDLRLWTKRALIEIADRVLELQEALLTRADDAGDAYLPGYTHLQQAQPVLLAHHLLAHGWALARDVDRLLAARTRADVSPLGRRSAGWIVASTRSRRDGCRPRVRVGLRQLARCGERSRLRRRGPLRDRAVRHPPVENGGGVGAVVERGARLRFARRRLRHR